MVLWCNSKVPKILVVIPVFSTCSSYPRGCVELIQLSLTDVLECGARFRVPYFSGSARSTCLHYVGAFLCVKCVFVVAVSPLVRLKGIKKLLLLVVRIPSGVHGHVIALERLYTENTLSYYLGKYRLIYRFSFQFKVLNFSTGYCVFSEFKEYRYCFFLLATPDKATSRIVCLIDCCIYVLFCTMLVRRRALLF
jgi:hypothetical protein